MAPITAPQSNSVEQKLTATTSEQKIFQLVQTGNKDFSASSLGASSKAGQVAPKAEASFLDKVWNCFSGVFRAIFFCCFPKGDQKEVVPTPTPTPAPALSKQEQYAGLVVAGSVKGRKERKEAIKAAFENLSPDIKAKLGEAYEEEKNAKDSSVLAAHLAKGKSGAIEFVLDTAKGKWARNVEGLYDDFIEIAKDDTEKKSARSFAETLMDLPEVERKAALIHIFQIKGNKVDKMYNDEGKIARELAKIKRKFQVDDGHGNISEVEENIFLQRAGGKKQNTFVHPVFLAQLEASKIAAKK